MKKTIYFHVGTVKTGSTLIQKVLWENKSLLEKFNFHYFNLVEPKLSLPRYANAEFLFDKDVVISDEEVQNYIDNLDVDNIIISEEGLWANMGMLSRKVFDKYDKKVILYVRKPVDLISAWASENAEPYNALQTEASSGIGVVPIEKGIEEFTKRYIKIFETFFKSLEILKKTEIIIRPYDRSQFENKDIFRDFLNILDINTDKFLKDPKYTITEVANASRTRKFCDVSTTVWDFVNIMNERKKYNLELVEYIYKNCNTGDDRAVIETLSNQSVIEIYDKLKFIEDEISIQYLNGKRLFENSLPFFMDSTKKRMEYKPVSKYEIKMLIHKFFHDQYNYNTRYKEETLEDARRIDSIKELALEFEKNYDVDIAYKLMQIAHELRPHGPFIKDKYIEYKRTLEETSKK